MEFNAHIDEYIDLQKYWTVLRRRYIPATATLVAIVTLSIVASLLMPKKYEADARLLIETNKSSKLTGLENDIGSVEGLTQDSDPLATEATIITSRPIVKKLIQELNLVDANGKNLEYQDFIENLKVKSITGTDVLEISYRDSDPELSAEIVNKLVALYIEDDKTNNQSDASKASVFIAEKLPEVEATVKKAETNLRQFKNQHQIARLDEETTLTIDNTSNIQNQIKAIEGELRSINARHSSLSLELGMSPEEAGAISALSESISVQQVLKQLQTVKVELTQKSNYFSDNTPQIISLKEQESDLNKLLAKEIENTLGSDRQNLVDRVNILNLGKLKQSQIAEFANLNLAKKGLEEKLASLKDFYNIQQQKFQNLPELEEQQRELERKLQAAQTTYQTLLRKLEENRIAEQQKIGNVRVVSSAVVPDKPIAPKKKLIVIGGGLVGTFLGIALAFILDIRDNTIKDSREAENLFAYPIQGIIPEVKDWAINPRRDFPQLPGTTDSPDSPSLIPVEEKAYLAEAYLVEAYQDINFNLNMLETDTGYKLIAVTSSVPKEGKSSVSANLAQAKAQQGERVLIIDSDLRRPKQHIIWNVDNSLGLSNLLTSQLDWHHVVKNLESDLDLLPAGTIPNYPAKLLNSEIMKQLIADLSDHYDWIIFDTPPLVGMSDTKIIGKLVDGFLFVVRPQVADYFSVNASKKTLEAKGFKVLGIVVNGVKIDRDPYGYQYKRGYSYSS